MNKSQEKTWLSNNIPFERVKEGLYNSKPIETWPFTEIDKLEKKMIFQRGEILPMRFSDRALG